MREGPSNRLAGVGLKPPSAAVLLRSVVVNGEGKGPEERFGSGDFQEEDRKGATVSRVEKN
jgi:hypothetical protein